MNPPKISVVIPSFNKGKRIEETLKSIFNQKYKNIEVIVQDGGSTDGTVSIIKKYSQKYGNHLKWESKNDKGQLDAVKKGLEKSSGEIITFINADDVYQTGTFDLVARKYLENPNSLWFAGRSHVINKSGNEIVKFVTWYKNFLFSFNNYSILLMANYLMQPSIFITRSAYKKYGPFIGTQDFIMEYDLWLKIGKEKMPIIINSDLSKFRIEEDTKTKTMFPSILKEDERIVRNYTDSFLILSFHYVHNFVRKIIGVLL